MAPKSDSGALSASLSVKKTLGESKSFKRLGTNSSRTSLSVIFSGIEGASSVAE